MTLYEEIPTNPYINEQAANIDGAPPDYRQVYMVPPENGEYLFPIPNIYRPMVDPNRSWFFWPYAKPAFKELAYFLAALIVVSRLPMLIGIVLLSLAYLYYCDKIAKLFKISRYLPQPSGGQVARFYRRYL